MRRALLALPLLAALTLTGCSQIAAIAPVGGNHLTEVRFATIDVLQQKGIALEAVPTCTRSDEGAIACTGTTAAGEAVTAASPSTDPDSFRVTVGSDTVFTGSVSDVIDRAAGVTP
ncbi:MAG: hypothetical protein BGO45_07520 [Microbacterium sp. 71-36]|uniref:hypothetical protein n=1 Tax=unclassified Microbacterium TaxID=2609290 RepID=UPI00086A1ADB|nr:MULTISPECIES: hypothetical protein [unclassified Microbacterium]MBN9210270.1 hypothetical protein [Microbacterium sp.]ODT40000.1 MAG: hypothetical protein ABS60_05175 [Microbacterium sp. SCN 71-17]OJV74448.1 MAG: hypothetical protein BGO45_07520 [Microbacterium sp. 71-36]